MQPTDPNTGISPSTGERRTEMTMTQSDLTARIDETLKGTENHTPGPWYGEDAPRTWQLFARRVEPWPDGTPIDLRDDNPEGMELHPLQILKAPKKGTPFAEYWPEPADAALIASAPTLRALLVEARAQIAAQAEAQKAVLVLIDLALDCWEQFAFRADDGSLWDGGLSTLERLEGILGPLGLLNERQEAARPLPVLPFGNDDEVVVAAARAALGAQS